jgi:hypothetical protein
MNLIYPFYMHMLTPLTCCDEMMSAEMRRLHLHESSSIASFGPINKKISGRECESNAAVIIRCFEAPLQAQIEAANMPIDIA